MGLDWKRCDGCLACDLLPENLLAWEIYSRVGSQVIVTEGHILGVNVLAAYRVMESFGVTKEQEVEILDKVLLLHEVHFPIKAGDKDVPKRKQ